MEAKEPPLTYLYQYVDLYRQENNITPMQWYISNLVRARFWDWLEHNKGQKPMVISFTQEVNGETQELIGASIDEERYER
jgi:hypothetical protein